MAEQGRVIETVVLGRPMVGNTVHVKGTPYRILEIIAEHNNGASAAALVRAERIGVAARRPRLWLVKK